MFKKVIFSVMLCVALLASTQSVSALPGIKYGVGVGANISSIQSYNDDINIGSGWGFQVGAHVGLDLLIVSITPEIWYTSSYAAYDAAKLGGDFGTLNVESLDVPIIASISILGPLKLKVGPSFSLWSKATLPSGEEFTNAKSSCGYVAGVGLEFLNIGIDLRYNGQFSKSILPLGSTVQSTLDPQIRANSISVIMNYSF